MPLTMVEKLFSHGDFHCGWMDFEVEKGGGVANERIRPPSVDRHMIEPNTAHQSRQTSCSLSRQLE